MLNMVSTPFKVGAFNGIKMYPIKDTLVINNLPDISNCLRTARNLEHVANAKRFIHQGKFSLLPCSRLGMIIGIKEYRLIHFIELIEPDSVDEPFVELCKLGVCVFGRDKLFTAKPLVRSNLTEFLIRL